MFIVENKAGPDEMPRSVAFHLGFTVFKVPRIQRVNGRYMHSIDVYIRKALATNMCQERNRESRCTNIGLLVHVS